MVFIRMRECGGWVRIGQGVRSAGLPAVGTSRRGDLADMGRSVLRPYVDGVSGSGGVRGETV